MATWSAWPFRIKRLEHVHQRTVLGVDHHAAKGRGQLLVQSPACELGAVAAESGNRFLPACGFRLIGKLDDIGIGLAFRHDRRRQIFCGQQLLFRHRQTLVGIDQSHFLLLLGLRGDDDHLLRCSNQGLLLVNRGLLHGQLLLGHLLLDLLLVLGFLLQSDLSPADGIGDLLRGLDRRDQRLNDLDALLVTGRFHGLLEILLESGTSIAGNEFLAGMIGASETSVGTSIRQDHLADDFLGQGLSFPFLVVENIGGGGLFRFDPEFDDRLQADPKAVLGGKSDVLEVVSLAAAIDQTNFLHIRIQIVRARLQRLGLCAPLAFGRKQFIGLLGHGGGEIGDESFVAGGNRNRIVQFNDLGIVLPSLLAFRLPKR